MSDLPKSGYAQITLELSGTLKESITIFAILVYENSLISLYDSGVVRMNY